jgi:tetratricopeptide (TPR) repeat protein
MQVPEVVRDGEGRAAIRAGAVLVVATFVVYANSLHGPFVLDDRSAVVENLSIRSLAHLGDVLHPPHGSTTGGRPFYNLTYALNYAWSGLEPWSYHLLNVVIHALGGLALFGIVRRTLKSPAVAERFRRAAFSLACAVAAIWVLHPLQTESVTYISQRAESLMGLFYLLTLYCFIQGTPGWLWLSVGSCLLGAATKEVMVTAPVVILLYDRAFWSSSFREALRKRQAYYFGLVVSWFLLGALIAGTSLGSRSVGFHQGVSVGRYVLTEIKVVPLYVARALWPHPLVFDYGPEVVVSGLGQVVLPAALLLAAVAAAVVAWRRSKPVGFLAISFFILLSPTSSFVPVAMQPMAESRMYLPLACIAGLAVVGVFAVGGRRALVALGAVAVVLGALTIHRNADYQTELRIWEDTVAKRPGTSRGQYCLGVALGKVPGRGLEAIGHYEEAIRLKPDYAEAYGNCGIELGKIPGREKEALARLEESLRLDPGLAKIHYGYGVVLEKIPGREADAIAAYEKAVELDPAYMEAENNLANLLIAIPGREAESIAHYERALALLPDNANVISNLANAHYKAANRLITDPGRVAEATAHYEKTVELLPGFAAAHYNLGVAYANSGRYADAAREWETVLRLEPGNAQARANLATLRAMRK